MNLTISVFSLICFFFIGRVKRRLSDDERKALSAAFSAFAVGEGPD